MNNNIIALWLVHGENYPAMYMEATSDVGLFGITPDGDGLAGYNLQLIKCTPAKIEDSRVEMWRGWAVITWGYVEPQLLLHTITVEEESISSGLSRAFSSLQKLQQEQSS